jgi:membrane-associated protease RseP (regulator of RpoE activity)
MSENYSDINPFTGSQHKNYNLKKYVIVHILLFVVTFVTTSIAGVLWSGQDYTNLSNISVGFTYAVLILGFLSAHEFGHYFAARIHGIDATLPYYIPFLPILGLPNFGTLGAVIRTRTPIASRKALFDVGVSGPIAGFIVCLIFLYLGLANLPGKEFIYNIHPEYLKLYNGEIPTTSLFFGDTFLYSIFVKLFANPNGWLPPMNEIYHYPLLNVGWFGLFVTTLNMLPLGQLDGGHVTYAMFGNKQFVISKIFWWIIVIIGFGSLFNMAYIELQSDSPNSWYIYLQDFLMPILTWMKQNIPWYFKGWDGWLFWAVITRLFLKLNHPLVGSDEPLDTRRMIIGWIAIAIFILSFSYNGIYFVE